MAVRFEDFVLQIDANTRGGFRARVLKSPFGEGTAGFSLPWLGDAELVCRAGAGQGGATIRGASLLTTHPPLDIGAELFRGIFQGPVRTLLDKSRGRLEVSPELGLRLKIKLDSGDEEIGALADLPWELLYDSETKDCFALSRQMSLVRYLDVPRPSQPIAFVPPLRILAVGASPHGLPPLDLAEEEENLKRLRGADVEVEFLAHASAGAVRQALAGDTFHVLHFMGHGAFDDVTGEGALAFERSDASPDLVSGEAFATKVCDLPSLGVVMLNACNTARANHQSGAPYRGVATALVHGGVPAVVAMQQPISDGAAIGFSTAFYRHLSRGGSLDEALTEGRQAIHSAKPDSLEWATPVLFLRVPEGDVFAPKPAEETTPRMPAGFGVGFAPVLFPSPDPVVSGRKWALRLAAGACGAALLAFVLVTRMLDPSANAAALPVAQESPAVPPAHPPASRLEPKVEPAPAVEPAPTVPAWRPWEKTTVSQISTTVEYSPIETEIPAPQSPEPRLQPAISAVPAQPIYVHVYHPAPVPAARPEDDPWPEPAPDVEETSDSFEPFSEPVRQPARMKSRIRLGKGAKDQQQIAACVRQRAWIAYFQNDQGELAPLRDTLNTENDEDWIGLRFTEYEGPRIRLGVLKVINRSAESEEQNQADRIEVPASGIQELLTSALDGTKRFDVIEQKRVHEVQAQQTRADVVEPSPTSIINIGRVLGAQYLVYGTVNEWNPDRGSRSLGPASLFKAGKNEAEVAITFTLTDVSNGQILFTTSERARLGSNGGSGEAKQNTPVNYAIRACVNKGAFKIATFLRDRKWQGSVVDIKKADLYINAGSQQGMGPQTRLSVQAVRGIVKDPENGTILGEDLRGIGTLEVVAVQPGFSIARIVEGCNGIKKGDRVELATDPVIPQVPPECEALPLSYG